MSATVHHHLAVETIMCCPFNPARPAKTPPPLLGVLLDANLLAWSSFSVPFSSYNIIFLSRLHVVYDQKLQLENKYNSFGTHDFISFDENEMKSHSCEVFIWWGLNSKSKFYVWLSYGFVLSRCPDQVCFNSIVCTEIRDSRTASPRSRCPSTTRSGEDPISRVREIMHMKLYSDSCNLIWNLRKLNYIVHIHQWQNNSSPRIL